MKLIDLLVKELPKRGGWPEGANYAAQDWGGLTVFYIEKPYLSASCKAWDSDEVYLESIRMECAEDFACAIITPEQYDSALAASDGWIEWNGGECPVNDDCIVDVKFMCGQVENAMPARYWEWGNQDHRRDIISYRLHKPGINSRANDDRQEQDLNECIGQGVDMPEWMGGGLPPVGTICEAKVPRPITGWEWRKVKVVESGIPGAEKEALVYDLDTTSPSWADEFRPLRNEAEKAREDAETAMRTCLAGTGAGITPLAAKGIYEAIAAGKIPGIKLEDK